MRLCVCALMCAQKDWVWVYFVNKQRGHQREAISITFVSFPLPSTLYCSFHSRSATCSHFISTIHLLATHSHTITHHSLAQSLIQPLAHSHMHSLTSALLHPFTYACPAALASSVPVRVIGALAQHWECVRLGGCECARIQVRECAGMGGCKCASVRGWGGCPLPPPSSSGQAGGKEGWREGGRGGGMGVGAPCLLECGRRWQNDHNGVQVGFQEASVVSTRKLAEWEVTLFHALGRWTGGCMNRKEGTW